MTVLLLEDDHFFNDKDRAKQILRELAALGIRVEFPNGVAVYAIDDEVAELFPRRAFPQSRSRLNPDQITCSTTLSANR